MKKFLFASISLLSFSTAFSFTPADSLNLPDSLPPRIYDDRIFKESIHTVRLCPTGLAGGYPIFSDLDYTTLLLSFDELDSEFKTYHYTVVHCDANWQASDLQPKEYLGESMQDVIKSIQGSVNTRQQFVHYSVVFPNENMQIKLPGNYAVLVYEGDSSDHPVLTARMMYLDHKANINGKVHQATGIEDKKFKQEVDFQISRELVNIADPYNDIKVCIMQNRRKDNAISDLKPKYASDKVLDYNYESENVFEGGNEFRQFVISSFQKPGWRVASIRKGEDGLHLQVETDKKRSYLRYSYDGDMNGGYEIKTLDGANDSLGADYGWVHFTLQTEETFEDGGLYVMGDFCHWNYDTANRMIYSPEAKAYHAKIYLKQGSYNYCYLYKSDSLAKGESGVVEGDHYETGNNYLILVYHRAPGSRYDSLISATPLSIFRKE